MMKQMLSISFVSACRISSININELLRRNDDHLETRLAIDLNVLESTQRIGLFVVIAFTTSDDRK